MRRPAGAVRTVPTFSMTSCSPAGTLVALQPNRRGEMVYSTAETLARERRMLLDAMERLGKRQLDPARITETQHLLPAHLPRVCSSGSSGRRRGGVGRAAGLEAAKAIAS